jgi:hypothetical protein
MPFPISVSEDQYLAVVRAAAVLHPADREQFVASVAHELAGKPVVGDGVVGRAIAGAFRTFFHPPEEAAHPPSRWNRG